MASTVPVSIGSDRVESPLASPVESPGSGVSWAAVLAGAVVTAALSFALMTLGAGTGLSSISPWPTAGLSASRVAAGAIIWIALVQAASCALGGYLAGRLRTKWVAVHTHEVYFRDTAHGFLVWAVGLVISVFFLSSVGLSLARDASDARSDSRNDYFVDTLFRTGHPIADGADATYRAEAKEIFVTALRGKEIAPQDRAYLADLVASRTGLSRPEAEARVDKTLADNRLAIDDARKAVAHSLYWLFAALLIGAFCASYTATIGGRQRDRGFATAPSARRV